MLVRKLFTLLRAYEVDASQAVIDSHAPKILEQELRDAASGVAQATRELTSLMAHEIATRRRHEAAVQRVQEHEGFATRALEKGDEVLARQCAEVVAAAEAERDRHVQDLDVTRRHIAGLRAGIANADARIAEIRREWLAARSRAALQRATGALAQCSDGVSTALAAAEETLARIGELQASAADHVTAAEQLADEKSGASLHRRLAEAGLAPHAPYTVDAVLARLRDRARDTADVNLTGRGKETIMHSDSPAWALYSYVSFVVAMAMMAVGIAMIPGEPWIHAYFVLSTFFLMASCFTLAKMLRDRHEGQRLHQRIEDARTEQLLKTYDLRPPTAP
jgi:phage shock protein A